MANRLEEFRRRAGHSRESLARAIGMQPTAIKCYEVLDHEPGVRTGLQIAEALSADPSELWPGDLADYGGERKVHEHDEQTKPSKSGIRQLFVQQARHSRTQIRCR